MKLAGQSLGSQRLVQRVDAIGDKQRRTGGALGEEVADGAVHRPRDAHGDAVVRHQREGAVDSANGVGIARQHASPTASSTSMLWITLSDGSSRSTMRLMG